MIPGSVGVTEAHDTTVLTVSGDLDLHGAPSLRNKLRQAVGAAEGDIVMIDLSAVGAIDDIGIGVLLGLRRMVIAAGRRLVVQSDAAGQKVIDELGVGSLLSDH